MASGRLSYLAYRGAESAVSAMPRGVADAVAIAAAETMLLTRPRRFSGLRANLEHVLPDADRRTLRRVLHANVRNLARNWVDVMEMPHRADSVTSRVHPVNVENMTAPLERGRGVVIVSLHLGSWEVGLAGWNHRFGRMSLLAERLKPDALFERIVRSRERLGVTVIPIDTAAMRCSDAATARRLGVAAVRDVVRTLRANGMVAMAMDRDLIGNGEAMPFFGEAAPIPLGVVDVAIRCGAAIVPVILLRSGHEVVAPCWPEIAYDPDADREQEVRRVAAEVLSVFESVIREHPDQWHVLDPIWRDGAAA